MRRAPGELETSNYPEEEVIKRDFLSGESEREEPKPSGQPTRLRQSSSVNEVGRIELESSAAEGESPVIETLLHMGLYPEYHETRETLWEAGGPPSKPKYWYRPIAHSTVRERWKEPLAGSEREPETVCLQTVEVCIYQDDGVPIEEWTDELLLLARLMENMEPQRKRVWTGRSVSDRPETVVIYPWPGWSTGKIVEDRTRERWKALGWVVDRGEMPIEHGDSWFSRNSFRASLEVEV